jgi:arabinogalactan oligomer / maltooligosaccharide transport system permease protein
MFKDMFDRRDSAIKIVLIYLALIVMCIIAVYPILNVLAVSLRPGDMLFQQNLRIIPENATLDNYKTAILDSDLFIWMRNSLLVSAFTALFGIVVATTAGYAYSRFKFRGRDFTLTMFLLTQIFPAPMVLLPTYIILRNLGLLNNFIGLIIPYTATAIPFCIWNLKGYFDTIPRSLEESAYLDGANVLQTFWKIILPLAKPAIAITALFSFMTAWSEYIIARVILSKSLLYTLPMGLVNYKQEFNTQWGVYSATALITAIPAIILFISMSKYLVSGLTIGSVKE